MTWGTWIAAVSWGALVAWAFLGLTRRQAAAMVASGHRRVHYTALRLGRWLGTSAALALAAAAGPAVIGTLLAFVVVKNVLLEREVRHGA